MKKEDKIGLVGGAGCFILSELDPALGLFWVAAGVLMLAWTLVSIYRRKKPGP